MVDRRYLVISIDVGGDEDPKGGDCRVSEHSGGANDKSRPILPWSKIWRKFCR